MTQARSTFEEKLTTLYAMVRAGKDPDTGNLHMDEEQFVQAIRDLIKIDVIGEDDGMYEFGHNPHDETQSDNRNGLRDEQRAIVDDGRDNT